MKTRHRLATYQAETGPRPAVLVNDDVYDLRDVLGADAPSSIIGLLDGGDAAQAAIAASLDKGAKPSHSLRDVKLLAPLLYPGAIYIAGANYSDHVQEMAHRSGPTGLSAPWHILKASRAAIVGPDASVTVPRNSQMVDWEIELAVVIGREARNVPVDGALDNVAGYTIANDLSARDISRRPDAAEGTTFRLDWIAHKSFDSACPLGPWIVPRDQVADPQALSLKLWLNDELKQDSNTSYMIFGVAEQVAALSAKITLYPGDVILTGTPSGTGSKYNRFIKPGDRVKAEIDGLGDLVTHFV